MNVLATKKIKKKVFDPSVLHDGMAIMVNGKDYSNEVLLLNSVEEDFLSVIDATGCDYIIEVEDVESGEITIEPLVKKETDIETSIKTIKRMCGSASTCKDCEYSKSDDYGGYDCPFDSSPCEWNISQIEKVPKSGV